MGYEITKNVYEMFYHQPVLTICLFGVPTAFFSIIIYSICSADFSVDRDEVYPDDEEDSDESGGEDIGSETQDSTAPLLRHRIPRQHYDENESSNKSESDMDVDIDHAKAE